MITVISQKKKYKEESINIRYFLNFLNQAAHPGEKKELHHKLNTAITQLDLQEKSLNSQKYIKACLVVLSEEKNHNLEGLSNDIDNALKHYLDNMFEVYIHEDKL